MSFAVVAARHTSHMHGIGSTGISAWLLLPYAFAAACGRWRLAVGRVEPTLACCLSLLRTRSVQGVPGRHVICPKPKGSEGHGVLARALEKDRGHVQIEATRRMSARSAAARWASSGHTYHFWRKSSIFGSPSGVAETQKTALA